MYLDVLSGTKLELMPSLVRKSLERGDKAVVDTLIRDQAEFTECRLMLWLIPKEGTKNWKASRR